mgnify:CR=1 FL=1
MIRLYPDPILRRRARPVTPGSPQALAVAAKLRAAFSQLEGLGLAANQVGELARVVLVRLGEEDWILLNPEVVWRSPELESDSEGCLSLPGVEAEVARPAEIKVRAQGEDGAVLTFELEGLEARLLLHEIDHLDGVLYIDHLAAPERRRVLREYRALREAEHKEGAPSRG